MCTERGVLVVNQSGGNAEAVAEHVIGMMLCLVKRVGETDRALRAGAISNRADYIGREAYGRTLGIVGLGNVGRRIAELAGGLFKMQVLAYDPYLSADVVRSPRRHQGRTRRPDAAIGFRFDQLPVDAGNP